MNKDEMMKYITTTGEMPQGLAEDVLRGFGKNISTTNIEKMFSLNDDKRKYFKISDSSYGLSYSDFREVLTEVSRLNKNIRVDLPQDLD